MGQPQGSADWATNENYASPGDAWDGTPTKVPAVAGLREEGWEPESELGAQILNDWQNRAGALLTHLRFMQPANWELLRDFSPTTSQRFRDIGYDPSTGIYVVTGDDANTATFRSRDGGTNWTAPTTPPIALPFGSGVDSDGAGNWVIVAESPSISESGDSGDTWTTRVPGSNYDEGNDVKYDPVSGLWVISGQEDLAGANGRSLMTSPDRITWTSRISTSVAGQFLGELWVNAAGFGVVLSNSNQYFTSPDMVNWTQRAITGATSLFDVVYSEGAGLWFMSVNLGGTRAVLTSSDGTTWTQPAGQTGIPAETFGSISCDQGELVVLGYGSSAAEIVVSVDRGLTFQTVAGIGGAVTLPRGPEDNVTPTGFGDIKQQLNFLAGRFITVSEGGNLWRTPSMP